MKKDEPTYFAFKGKHGEFSLSHLQLLECLQILAFQGDVPPIPPDWLIKNIPPDHIVTMEDIEDEKET